MIMMMNGVSGFMPPPISNKPWFSMSWEDIPKASEYMPVYKNKDALRTVQGKLNQSAPIVFAEEIRELERQLEYASIGKSFVLIGGDCAETFQDANVNKLWKDFSLFLRLSVLLTYGLEMPVLKIGRMAGQYAKPRSTMLETFNNITLPSYQGDIVNSNTFDRKARQADPKRMLEAYHLSTQSLNIIRAFIQGGYTDIFNYDAWSSFDTVGEPFEYIYNNIIHQFKKSLRFMETLKISSDTQKNLRDISFFIGHECLLLPYEQCLVRNDSLTGKYYDFSSHFLWIGERTRQLDGPHIEFCRGIHNPIGVKISETITPTELLNMTYVLNPENKHGRLVLMTRMGKKKLNTYLPDFIRILQDNKRNVVWICDPMHANTQSVQQKKTRFFMDIYYEIMTFCEIHWKMGSIPAGIHLEMTGQNVTECLGGYVTPVTEFSDYRTAMDPRLNPTQTLEMMLLIIQLFNTKNTIMNEVPFTLKQFLDKNK